MEAGEEAQGRREDGSSRPASCDDVLVRTGVGARFPGGVVVVFIVISCTVPSLEPFCVGTLLFCNLGAWLVHSSMEVARLRSASKPSPVGIKVVRVPSPFRNVP
jgi:hypothetical protein